MAKESVAILKGRIDVSEVLDELNAALSEEWLAFYQYWVGALVVKGAMRGDVQREFQEHAMEEFEHAKLIADRIIELEGVPVLDPKKWFDLAKCAYTPPTDVDVVKLLKQNVAAERCAILRYQTIAALTDGKDFTTCDIAKHILAEEEDHEQDLQDYLDDIAHMKEYVLQYPNLGDIDLHIDQTESEPVNYSIQTSGLVKLSEDVCGNQIWQYNALLQSREYTADDLSRLNASAFTEDFIFWIEKQNSSRNYPELAGNFEPISISADNGILLALDEDGDRGLYQIQIHFTFEEEI